VHSARKVLREDLQQNQIPSETWPAARRESQEDSMNRVFLVMVVSALLATFGLAQTPAAGSNTGPANVKGCLGGSDGNYTVVEDGTRQTFKITTSSVDLKAHLGHDVKLTGHKAGATASPGAADNSFAVTELSMISEHCAAAAAAPAATVIPPAETVIAPDPAPTAPATTASAPAAAPATPSATASAPAVDAAAPAATVAPSVAVASTPAVEPVAPAATVAPTAAAPATPAVEAAAPVATVEPSPVTPPPAVEPAAPIAKDARPARLSAHARKLAAAKAAAAAESAEPVAPTPEPAAAPTAEAATPATAPPVSPSAETVAAPDATAPDAAAAPAPAATHRTGSLALLITFVVLVIVLGTTAPLIGRWRKRKALERDGSPNLSFTNDSTAAEVTTNEAGSGRDKAGPRKVA
jgi:hypothetical protein